MLDHALPRQLSRVTAQEPVDLLARAGYAARGVVYGLIGFFAVRLSLGMGGGLTDTKGLFRGLLDQPLGNAFLLAIGFGLFCYAAWRVLLAVRDYERLGTGAKGLAVRAGYLLRGLLHAALGFSAWNLVLHFSKGEGMSEPKLAGMLLGQSHGALLTGVLGGAIMAAGAWQFYLAFAEKFTRGLRLPSGKRWLLAVCKAGLCARGVVFLVVGWLFVRAGWLERSREAAGLRGVWRFLREMPYGQALVLALGAGLLAFAVYGFVQAAYRESHAA